VTRPLSRPFLVLATQNPIEYEGTFPLPEAQLDRFMLRIRLGYPGTTDEMAMLDSQQFKHPVEALQQVLDAQDLVNAQEEIKSIHVDAKIKSYIVELMTQTRKHTEVSLGASPRGSLVLYRTAQARAAMSGRDYVIPDDIKALAPACLAHRMIVSPSARIKDITAESILLEILNSVPVPGASVRPR
jgi:MoxR-like ATPase